MRGGDPGEGPIGDRAARRDGHPPRPDPERRAGRRRAACPSWTGLQYPLLTESGTTWPSRAMARSCWKRRRRTTFLRSNPVGRQRWQHRLPAGGRIPLRKGGHPDLLKPGWTGEPDWDGAIPYETFLAGGEPASRVPGNRQQPHRRRRLPAHITSEWMAGYRAQRIEEMLSERERHPSTTSSACSTTSSRCRGSRPRKLSACTRSASARPVLSSGSRAGTACCPRLRRGHGGARLHGRVRAGDVRGGAGPGGGGTLDEPLRLLIFEIVFAVAAPVSACWSCGTRTTRPGSAAAAAGWTRLERGCAGVSSRRSTASRSASAKPDRWRWGRVHAAEFMHPFGAANPALPAHLQPQGGGRGGWRDRDADRLPRDVALQGRVGAGVPDGGRPGRSLALAVAADDRPVRPPRLAAVRRHARGLADRGTNPAYLEDHEIHAAGGARSLRLHPD